MGLVDILHYCLLRGNINYGVIIPIIAQVNRAHAPRVRCECLSYSGGIIFMITRGLE